MKFSLAKTENEDKIFVDVVEKIAHKLISFYQPEKVYLIKIDNWFDHKWLEFSGKISGELGVWLKNLRVPPFVPDRVVEELHFLKNVEGYEIQNASNLHIYRTSEKNTLREIKLISNSAIFIWYSGNTAIIRQTSLMFYQVENGAGTAWYASFMKKHSWQLHKTMNISRNEVLGLIE